MELPCEGPAYDYSCSFKEMGKDRYPINNYP